MLDGNKKHPNCWYFFAVFGISLAMMPVKSVQGNILLPSVDLRIYPAQNECSPILPMRRVHFRNVKISMSCHSFGTGFGEGSGNQKF